MLNKLETLEAYFIIQNFQLEHFELDISFATAIGLSNFANIRLTKKKFN